VQPDVATERRGRHGAPDEDADSARLVRHFQAGDQDAFRALYMRYFDAIYAYLLVALRDRGEAEDVAQQVFMKVFTALPRYEDRGLPFRGWLFRIARNSALGHLRRRRPAPEDPARLAAHADSRLNEFGEASLTAADRDLMTALSRLPLSQRQVLFLRYTMDMSAAETAMVIGRSPQAVRQLQQRAMRTLRERLGGGAPATVALRRREHLEALVA
jgi:RNA polymerase sigma-70 factor, ECF subfamily